MSYYNAVKFSSHQISNEIIDVSNLPEFTFNALVSIIHFVISLLGKEWTEKTLKLRQKSQE